MNSNFKSGEDKANPLEIDVTKLKEKLDRDGDYYKNYKLTKVLAQSLLYCHVLVIPTVLLFLPNCRQ